MGAICAAPVPEEDLDNLSEIDGPDKPQSTQALQTSSWFHYCYSRYICNMVIDRFQLENPRLTHSEREFVDSAVAFVDISGFTKLSEKLVVQYGENGAEMLNKVISRYFERLITHIREYGGDIIKFAGDAMLVVWKNPKNRNDANMVRIRNRRSGKQTEKTNKMLGNSDETLPALVLRAVACNVSMIKELNGYCPVPDISLTLHTGIGAGKLSAIFVGGYKNRWEFFVAGSPIEQMASAAEDATSGQVVISPFAYSLVQNVCSAKEIKPTQNFLIQSITDPPNLFVSTPQIIPDEMEEDMLGFIPRPVINRIDSGQPASWIAEYRSVYIMFIRLPDLEYDTDPDVIRNLQQGVLCVQQVVEQWQGTIARLLADDKGTRFKIAFGMPTVWHEDDGERTIMTALEIDRKLASLHLRSSIGIAHGTVYCGEAGSDKRCEYTAVGFKVNLAARLMSVAGINRILCDNETYQNAHDQFHFDIMPKVKVKGIADPISVFRPVCKRTLADTKGDAMKQAKLLGIEEKKQVVKKKEVKRVRRLSRFSIRTHTIIGREKELEIFDSILQDNASVAILEGEGGTGKSLLAASLRSKSLAAGFKTIVGYGMSLERNTPFFIWATLIDLLIGITDLKVPAYRSDKILPFIPDEYMEFADCLNDILGTNFEEPKDVKMTTNARATMTRNLLIGILAQLFPPPSLIILEDMHWVDSASWGVTMELLQKIPGTFLLLVLRPLGVQTVPEYGKLLKLPNVTHIKLELLSKENTINMACNRLNVRSIPPGIADIIFKKARGHPLYIEEMCNKMLEDKMLSSKNGICVVSATFTEDDLLKFPDSLEGVIVSRIDHLPVEPQLTLKVCSVIGGEIPVKVLVEVHPSVPKIADLKRQLKILEQTGFLESSTGQDDSDDLIYSFKNGFFQDVAYGLLLLAQRKLIHQNIAAYYQCQTENKSSYYGILAHHWLKAERFIKALEYSELAGNRAVIMNSSEDAIKYYHIALKLMDQLNITDKKRIQLCHTQLYRTYYATSRYQDSILHLQTALNIAGYQIPTGNFAVASFKASFKHFFNTAKKPLNSVKLDPDSEENQIAKLFERLAYTCILEGDIEQASYCTEQLTRIAENYNSTNLLALAYSQNSYLSILNGKVGDSIIYSDQASILLRSVDPDMEQISDVDQAQIIMHLSSSYASRGLWSECLNCIKEAYDIYRGINSRRRWREAAFIYGCASFYYGTMEDSFNIFSELFDQAQEDRDLLMEATSSGWLCMLQLIIKGPHNSISAKLEPARVILLDLHRSDFFLHCITLFNELQMMKKVNTSHLNSIADFAVQNLDSNSQILPSVLRHWHNGIEYVMICWLLIYAHMASKNIEVENVQPYKKFLKWAKDVVEHLKNFAKIYLFAENLVTLCEGAILLYSQDGRGLSLLQDISSPSEVNMPLINALSIYFMHDATSSSCLEASDDICHTPRSSLSHVSSSQLPTNLDLQDYAKSASQRLKSLGVRSHNLFHSIQHLLPSEDEYQKEKDSITKAFSENFLTSPNPINDKDNNNNDVNVQNIQIPISTENSINTVNSNENKEKNDGIASNEETKEEST